MVDPSVLEYNTRRKRQHGTSLEEQSLSSVESTNQFVQHMVSNCCKKEEKKPQSLAVPPVIPPKDAIMPIAPLTGNPFFTCIISKSHVQSPCQVSIPRSFYRYLPTECIPVTLTYQNKSWKMTYWGDRPLRRIDGGWRKFTADNKLKVGDGCVFELIDTKNLQLKVQILPGELPAEFNPTIAGGQNSESPIFID
ncbi:B3 domain-containing protein Os04g0386900-like [Dioscorea cayenensis subsp. rotundata]|uniref:B3 domain-containing protein Os04g0386900-like n=1 Tax=Dioscorea cayennensis subsp. rotundata TaxID=55577 RepID=A0AB40CST6_DIOCR|nr:B3 domain-containing protein Os04g0386900-like [Dioscorea cayenensis subsp. rotundata]